METRLQAVTVVSTSKTYSSNAISRQKSSASKCSMKFRNPSSPLIDIQIEKKIEEIMLLFITVLKGILVHSWTTWFSGFHQLLFQELRGSNSCKVVSHMFGCTVT